MLEERSTKPALKEEKSILMGKAWIKEGKNFSIAQLTEPVEGKPNEYKTSAIYPLIITDYCRISFGENKKMVPGKNQNTHWAFLNIEKDRLEEYKELVTKIR